MFIDVFVFRKSYFFATCLFSPVYFYTTIVANMFFISSVFFSIYSSRLFLYYSRRQQRVRIYLLFAYSFQQLSLAISINSFRYPFYSLRLLTQFYSNSPLFFYIMDWLESREFSSILNYKVFFFYDQSFLMKERALTNCLFLILSLYNYSTIYRLRCSSDSLQFFISLSSCWTSKRLFLSQFSPKSRLVTFSERRSKSMLLMGE